MASQDAIQFVFDDVFRPACQLIPDIVNFLSQHDSRTIVIIASNDSDSLTATYLLQSCFIECLGLVTKTVCITSYGDLNLALAHYNVETSAAVFILLNCCSRSFIFKHAIAPETSFFCLLDFRRPIDPEYVIHKIDVKANRENVYDPRKNKRHVRDSSTESAEYLGNKHGDVGGGESPVCYNWYFPEDYFNELKLKVYDVKHAKRFKENQLLAENGVMLQRLVDILSEDLMHDIAGEYCAHVTTTYTSSEAILESGVFDNDRVNLRSMQILNAVSLASLLLESSYNTKTYRKSIEKVLFSTGTGDGIRVVEDVNIPLLKFQSLETSIRTAILSLGSRLLNEHSLDSIRTELEIPKANWAADKDLYKQYSDTEEGSKRKSMKSVISNYLGIDPGAYKVPQLQLDTVYGIFSNLDLGLLFGNYIGVEWEDEVPATEKTREYSTFVVNKVEAFAQLNHRFLKLLKVLEWLKKPMTQDPQVSEFLQDLLAHTQTVQSESVGITSRLLLNRRCGTGILGLKNIFEGFVEENVAAVITQSTFAAKRIAFTLSRCITHAGSTDIEEISPHILLMLLPPLQSGKNIKILGYLQGANQARSNRIGAGIRTFAMKLCRPSAVKHDFFNAFVIQVPGEVGRAGCESLLPRASQRRRAHKRHSSHSFSKRRKRQSDH